jgi:hypothetical protein
MHQHRHHSHQSRRGHPAHGHRQRDHAPGIHDHGHAHERGRHEHVHHARHDHGRLYRSESVVAGMRPGAVLEVSLPAELAGAGPTPSTAYRATTTPAYSPRTSVASRGEGCPKTGGTGECIGDCRSCPYRGA